MMAILTKKEQLPLRDQLIADKIDAQGLSWRYDSEYNLKLLEDVPRVQVRREANNAPPPQVSKYAEAMRNGAQFPAGIVSRDRRTIDMNTREAAYKIVGITRAPVFIIQEDWGVGENAYDAQQRHVRAKMRSLGLIINLDHGLPAHEKEVRDAVMFALQDGYTVEGVMQEYHLPRPYVSNINNEVKALQRAADVGLAERAQELKPNQRQALGTADIEDNEVWRTLADLAIDAGLPGQQIRNLVSSIKAQPSKAEQLQVIRDERQARAAQIHDQHLRTQGQHTLLSGHLRRLLGFFIKHKNEEHLMVERNITLRQGYLDLLRQAKLILESFIRAQEEYIEQEEAI